MQGRITRIIDVGNVDSLLLFLQELLRALLADFYSIFRSERVPSVLLVQIALLVFH
jgi:hypothetical protein